MKENVSRPDGTHQLGFIHFFQPLKRLVRQSLVPMGLLRKNSSVYNLIFNGQMESRMDYNPPSVCRLRHARFHENIFCQKMP